MHRSHRVILLMKMSFLPPEFPITTMVMSPSSVALLSLRKVA